MKIWYLLVARYSRFLLWLTDMWCMASVACTLPERHHPVGESGYHSSFYLRELGLQGR